MKGFDLTDFGVAPITAPPQINNQVWHVPQPVRPQQEEMRDPNGPKTIDEALTSQFQNETLQGEEGEAFEDKLGRKAPGLKKQLWQVDKFANKIVPIQIVDKDGNSRWADANGNNIIQGAGTDENGNSIVEVKFKAPEAQIADRQELNYAEPSQQVPEIIIAKY